MRRYDSPLLALALSLTSTAAPAWSDSCEFQADRRITLAGPGLTRLEILARGGDLTVRPTSEPNVGAAGRACASSAEYLRQTDIRGTREGDVARVFVQVPDSYGDDDGGYAVLDLAVAVPAGVTVEILDSSGDIDVEAVRLARVTDSSGDVVVRDTAGDLVVDDSSGDLELRRIDGTLTLMDSSGDIEVDAAGALRIVRDSSGDIRASNVRGDVTIESDSSGDIVVEHVGGGVEVLSDSTGERNVRDVRGEVRLPEE